MSGEESPEPIEGPDERPWRRREYSGARSTFGLAALVILVVGFALWYFEFRGGSAGSTAQAGHGVVSLPSALNPSGASPAPEVGRLAPDFLLPRFETGEIRLSDLRGQYVLINFWASWCGPCRSEAPDLEVLAADTGANLVVVGVNQQEDTASIADFVAQLEVGYPIAMDRDGQVSAAYRVGRGLPVSFLVDRDGVIRDVYLGRLTGEVLAEIRAEAGG